MAKSSIRVRRFDPYKKFKFRVKWDDRYVAGVSKVGGLKRSTEVVEYREGGDPSASRKVPGRTTYEPITLERGVTHDTEFEKWASSIGEATVANFRKDIIIDFFNQAGKKVLSYQVFHCWVSEYQVLPELDGKANGVAIETLKLENEGWQRADVMESESD